MKIFRLIWFLFPVAAALARGASTESLAAQPGIVLSEPIFTGVPYPQSKPGKPGGPVQAQSHSSTIVETKSGLVAAWFGGTKEGNPDVGIWLSRQAGGKWTPPVEVANGAETEDPRVNCLNPVLFQVPGGPLLLFYRTGKWWPYVKRSTDDGVTWSKPERLYNGNFGPIKNKPVLLPDGSILSPASTEFSGWPAPGATGWDRRMWRVQFERLAPGNPAKIKATQWQVIGPVNDGSIDAIQPSILLHPGNRLQALGRTAQGRIFEIWSDDGGRTWGEMTLTGLPNPNSGTDAVTLKDGRHLLVYNHTTQRPGGKNGPRSPLNVAISADGKHWKGALVLENNPGNEFSYPAVIQTSDGLVHITYTWRRQHIQHVVVDPAKLVLRDMDGGGWPEDL
ncbi:MAG: exo-alpha-sialidase [Opitutaceae bacterium]|jgi:predicted neuraminidase|nr:exo-alpha-sialidase [Opitutaceae bacterium]